MSEKIPQQQSLGTPIKAMFSVEKHASRDFVPRIYEWYDPLTQRYECGYTPMEIEPTNTVNFSRLDDVSFTIKME